MRSCSLSFLTTTTKLYRLTVKKSLHLATESGEEVQPHQVRTFLEFGSERVPFSTQDMLKVKQTCRSVPVDVAPAYLLLIGFRLAKDAATSSFCPWYDRAFGPRSYLAYPNDDDAPGSRAAFGALHTSMIQKKVWAMGELVSTVRAMARLVIIIPQQEIREYLSSDERDQRTRQVQPPGFIISYLPYANDVRPVVTDHCVVPSAEGVAAAEAMILAQENDSSSATRSSYPVDWSYDIPNPALNMFWDYMESVALGLPLPAVVDETLMDKAAILDAAKGEIEAFEATFPTEEECLARFKSSKAAATVKKMNVSEFDPLQPEIMEDMARNGTLNKKCTVQALKGFLKYVGLRVTGKKEDLVQRVTDHVSSLMESSKNNGD
jgi:hypothetical protein